MLCDVPRSINKQKLAISAIITVSDGEGRGVYGVLVGRPEGKRPLGRPRRRWEDNIKTDLRDKEIDGVNWIWLAG
jgi:hypothetical protein